MRANALCPAFADTALVASLSKPGTSTNATKAMEMVKQVGIMS